jgi:hypothetical protein
VPVKPTYPGVYIEEVPSGVRTITGVATSITAFIGRALRGPVGKPVTINNYGDFERVFGGLWADSSLGYGIRDFFLNGGCQAIVIRVYRAASGNDGAATVDANTLALTAASPGTWGDKLRARIDRDTKPLPDGSPDSDTFNLYVRDGLTGGVEVFRNVSHVATHPRRVDKVVEDASSLVRVALPLPSARPTPHDAGAGQDVWADYALPTCSAVGTDVGSDGLVLASADFIGAGTESGKTGLYSLEKADLFNILCIPPYLDDENVDAAVVTAAATYCERRRAFLIVDSLAGWSDKTGPQSPALAADIGTSSKNAALFFSRLNMRNPLHENQVEAFAACGAVAGIFARTDAQRGVWKAPAGLDAVINGTLGPTVPLTDAENGELNPLAVNCLRTMPAVGTVVWGARTLQGDDRLASEWKYIPVRRTALFLEESLYRGTQWVVFEPNAEPLWAQIRMNIGSFMHGLFRQGAFQGTTPKEAYFVKCDKETTTQDDINQGIVNILVGFAPLKPAEFVMIKLQQMAGQIQV